MAARQWLRWAWLLMKPADRGRDAGCTVSTLPGNVCFTFNPVREAGAQTALREILAAVL